MNTQIIESLVERIDGFLEGVGIEFVKALLQQDEPFIEEFSKDVNTLIDEFENLNEQLGEINSYLNGKIDDYIYEALFLKAIDKLKDLSKRQLNVDIWNDNDDFSVVMSLLR